MTQGRFTVSVITVGYVFVNVTFVVRISLTRLRNIAHTDRFDLFADRINISYWDMHKVPLCVPDNP